MRQQMLFRHFKGGERGPKGVTLPGRRMLLCTLLIHRRATFSDSLAFSGAPGFFKSGLQFFHCNLVISRSTSAQRLPQTQTLQAALHQQVQGQVIGIDVPKS